MTARIAYLENGSAPDKFGGIINRMEAAGLVVDQFMAQKLEFPEVLNDYSGVFLSGSAYGAYEDEEFIHQEHEFLQNAAQKNIPILGVCFGSQILASALCGKDQVFRRDSCHVGYLPLNLTKEAKEDALLMGVEDNCRMLIWHNDEARADHPDMTLLATTDKAPNQIWRYSDKQIWGIQGHPEVNKENTEPWLEDVREYMEKDGVDIDFLAKEFDESGAGAKMIDNFISICLKNNKI